MKRLINYTIVFLLLTTNIFADERERQTRKVADAANAAKSCISNIPSQLNNIKYQLINAHNSLTKEIQSNLDSNSYYIPNTGPNGYIDQFGRLHGAANRYTNCATFPYMYWPG